MSLPDELDISQWIDDLEAVRDQLNLDDTTKALITTVTYLLKDICPKVLATDAYSLRTGSLGHAMDLSQGA